MPAPVIVRQPSARAAATSGETAGLVTVRAWSFIAATEAARFAASTPSLPARARLLHCVQLCDGPVDYDRSDAGLIRVAREARLFPGERGIDCVGLARAVPPEATISVEVPNRALARELGPLGRAGRALAATRRVRAAARQPAAAHEVVTAAGAGNVGAAPGV